MPSVSIIGQVLGCTGFVSDRVFCKYQLQTHAAYWTAIDGLTEGQTQLGVSTTNAEYDGQVFSHPIDVTYSTSSLVGWPKLTVEVWEQDEFGRNQLGGYGMCHVPTMPGMHSVECVTWRPKGSWLDNLSTAFIGGNPTLVNPSVVHTTDDRMELNAISCGTVHLDLQILINGFASKGVEFRSKASVSTVAIGGDQTKEVDDDETMSVYLGKYISSGGTM